MIFCAIVRSSTAFGLALVVGRAGREKGEAGDQSGRLLTLPCLLTLWLESATARP